MPKYRITEKTALGEMVVRDMEAASYDAIPIARKIISIEELDESGDVVDGIYPEGRSKEVHE